MEDEYLAKLKAQGGRALAVLKDLHDRTTFGTSCEVVLDQLNTYRLAMEQAREIVNKEEVEKMTTQV